MSQSPRNEPPRHKSLAREFMVPGIVFVGAIVVALLVLMFTGGADNGAAPSTTQENQIPEQLAERLSAEFDQHGIAEGPEDARVVVREFADYQCPACAIFEPTAHALREAYADNDDVRFVFFAFPLRSHQHARAAAQAAWCADKRDAFWPFHKRLFDKQQAWSQSGNPQSDFIDIAVESGIPVNPFRQCLEQDTTAEAVNQSQNVAIQVGVASTPTILVGRRVFSGVTSLERLKQEIDNQLAQ
ncbi:MAG: disulfide bond formation protein DsbA [Salinisphaeraceae bacterium]|nr:disulfide bond formation protein DsbA [Salinisphaeraceae bacterium]